MSEREILVDEGPPPPEPRSRRKLLWVLGIVGVVLAIGATAGIFFVRDRSKGSSKALPPAETVADPAFGWAISFPQRWQRSDEENTGNIRLTVYGPEKEPYVALRVIANALQKRVTEKELPRLKDELSQSIREDVEGAEITSARVVKLNRLPAIHLVYTFTELEGIQEGGGALRLLHSHYYVFNGLKVEQIVFETSPESFAKYSKTFDAIAASFRSRPLRPSPTPSPAG
jgi:flagellar basal body-associated protein FliL